MCYSNVNNGWGIIELTNRDNYQQMHLMVTPARYKYHLQNIQTAHNTD